MLNEMWCMFTATRHKYTKHIIFLQCSQLANDSSVFCNLYLLAVTVTFALLMVFFL